MTAERFFVLLSAVLGAASGCSTGPATSSETHFVKCETDSDCTGLGTRYRCDQMVCRIPGDGGTLEGGAGGKPDGSGGRAGGAGAGGGGSGGRGGASGAPADAGSGDAGPCTPTDPAALAGELATIDNGWVLVRVDYTSYSVLGYRIGNAASTDAGPPLDRDAALARAVADVQFDSTTSFSSGARLLSEDTPPDEWVFEKSPSDFGGLAVVSARTHETVFGGTVVWAGHGDILYPKSFEPASALGVRCSPATLPSYRAFDLGGAASGDMEAGAARAFRAAYTTALPDALSIAKRKALDAVVLFYPRSVGDVDPKSAEWLVVVNVAGP